MTVQALVRAFRSSVGDACDDELAVELEWRWFELHGFLARTVHDGLLRCPNNRRSKRLN